MKMLEQEVNGFTRCTGITPGFDKRSSDPKKDYGVGCVELWYAIKRDNKAVSFSISTNLYPAHIMKEDGMSPIHRWHSLGSIDLHCRYPWWEGQTPVEECTFIKGPCYVNGSGLRATEVIDKWLVEGDEVIWAELEEWWRERFEPEVKHDPSKEMIMDAVRTSTNPTIVELVKEAEATAVAAQNTLRNVLVFARGLGGESLGSNPSPPDLVENPQQTPGQAETINNQLVTIKGCLNEIDGLIEVLQ